MRDDLLVRGSRLVPMFLVGLAVVVLLAKGIEWSDQLGQSSSPAFRPDGADFRDFDGLVARLSAPSDTDRVSPFVWRELSDSTRAALTSKSSTAPSRYVREALLAADLNRIIGSGYSIYSEARFPSDTVWLQGFTLRLQRRTSLSRTPDPKDSAVVVVYLGEPFTFRVIEFPAKADTASEYFDLKGNEVFRSREAVDSIRKDLSAAELEPYVDTSDVPKNVAAPRLERMFHFLNYSGRLGGEIDNYLRKGKARSAAENRWLNRLLLEQAYEQEIMGKPKAGSRDFLGVVGEEFSRYFAADLPVFLRSQVWTIWILGLCSLIPALAGLIFRRAFWRWFVGTFVILFSINVVAAIKGWGHIGSGMTSGLMNPYREYVWIETLLILLVLAFRLERHSAANVGPATRRNNIGLAALLTLAALAWLYAMWARLGFNLYQLGGVSILLMVARALFVQSHDAANDESARPKNIVVCLDGTWNQPGTKDFGHLADTNVFKLFGMLKGNRSRSRFNASRSREYRGGDDTLRQVAFYYHGVGNPMENSELGQLFGGAFGMGAEAIVERAYLDVVRVYRPGDRIFIFGFSRGAAIARMLTGVIGRRDIPESLWTLRIFGRHWLVRRSTNRVDEQVPVAVSVLGCWDTVGAFGIAKNIFGIPFQRINLVRDLSVALCVKRAYHLVALDETRDAFEPTLMEPDPTTPGRVVEVWFSGNHANVGGGYSTDKLSDLTLDFLLRHLSSGYAWGDGMEPGRDESWGLYLNAARQGVSSAAQAARVLDPDPRGQLRHATGPMYSHLPRTLPTHAVIHDTVFERMASAVPVYAPKAIFALNERLLAMRAEIETEVRKLAATGSIGGETSKAILDRSAAHLGVLQWSKYLDSPQSDGIPMKAKLKAADELRNVV